VLPDPRNDILILDIHQCFDGLFFAQSRLWNKTALTDKDSGARFDESYLP